MPSIIIIIIIQTKTLKSKSASFLARDIISTAPIINSVNFLVFHDSLFLSQGAWRHVQPLVLNRV